MNKKLVSLVLCAVMVLTMAVGVFADSSLGDVVSDISYISSVTGTDEDKDGDYDITAYVIGDSGDLDGVLATLVLSDCTFTAKDVTDIVAIFDSEKSEPIYGSDGRKVTKYKLVFPDMEASTGDNMITFTIIRNDHTKVILHKSFFIGKNGGGNTSSGGTDSDEDDEDSSSKPIAALKPHLIVDGYSYGEAIAGQDVSLSFTLKNTSKNKIMRNIVLAVKPAGDLRIKSASDTIYIDTIDPGSTFTKSILFSLSASAKEDVQAVGLTSTFEYYDIENENAAAGGDTVSISIPTDTIERVKIQKVTLPDMLYPNNEEEVVYSVINSGFTTLYNAEIKIVDDAGTEYANAYIGSIEPSKAITTPDISIILTESGEKNLKFILTYENDKLQSAEVSKDFKATVMEIPVEQPPIFEEPMPGKDDGVQPGMNPIVKWSIIGGAVLAVIIITVIVVKAVKKKRSELDDEDI